MAYGFASKKQAYVQTKDRVCSRKKKFPSLPAAESQIRQFHVGDLMMRAYECQYCGKFHVGHGVRENY